MTKPRIFISCVSTELRTARQSVANALVSLGYEPVWQETFETAPGELLAMLRNKIDSSSGLIQLTGEAYGAEPPSATEEFGRVSYTQYEFLYAQKKGKLTWLISIGLECTRDTPVEALDLPKKPDSGIDPVQYQAERRSLQGAYFDRLKSENHLRHPASDDKDLEIKVLRLRDELLQLQRLAQKSIKRLLMLGGLTFLILMGVSIGGVIAFKALKRNSDLTIKQAGEHKAELDDIKEKLNAYFQTSNPAAVSGGSAKTPEEKHKRLAALAGDYGMTAEGLGKFLDEGAARLINDLTVGASDRVRALIYQGDYAGAAKTATDAEKRLEEKESKDRKERIALLLLAGEAQMGRGNKAEAEVSYRKAAGLAEKSDAMGWADTHARLAWFLGVDSQEAFHLWREIAPIDYATRGNSSIQTLTSYSLLMQSVEAVPGREPSVEEISRQAECIKAFAEKEPGIARAIADGKTSAEDQAAAYGAMTKMFTDTNRTGGDPELLPLWTSSLSLTSSGKFDLAEKAVRQYLQKHQDKKGGHSREAMGADFILASCSLVAQEYKISSASWLKIAEHLEKNEEFTAAFAELGGVKGLQTAFIDFAVENLGNAQAFDQALATVNEHWAAYAARPETRDLRLAYSHHRLGKEDEAAAFFDKVVARVGATGSTTGLDNAKLLNSISGIFLEKEKPDYEKALKAAAWAGEVAKKDPKKLAEYAVAMNNLAFCEHHLGKEDASRQHFGEWMAAKKSAPSVNVGNMALCMAQHETCIAGENEVPALDGTRKIIEETLFYINNMDAAEAIAPLVGLTKLLERGEKTSSYIEVIARSLLADAYCGAKIPVEAERAIQQALTAAGPEKPLEMIVPRMAAVVIATSPFDRAKVTGKLDDLEQAAKGLNQIPPPFLHKKYNLFANLFSEKNHLDLAERMLRLAVPELSLEPPEPPTDFLYSTRSLGLVLSWADRAAEARKCMERTLAVDMKVLKHDDPNIFIDSDSLADILFKLGKMDETENLLKKTVSMKVASLSPDDESIAYSETKLGLFYFQNKRFPEALKIDQKCLDILKLKYTEPDAKFVDILNNMGAALCNQGKYEEAIKYLERAESSARSTDNKPSMTRARIMFWMAKSMFGANQNGAAEMARKSLEMSETTFGKDNIKTKEAHDLVQAISDKPIHK